MDRRCMENGYENRVHHGEFPAIPTAALAGVITASRMTATQMSSVSALDACCGVATYDEIDISKL